jgi:hypothetical protein
MNKDWITTYRPITVTEADEARTCLVEAMELFAKECLWRFHNECGPNAETFDMKAYLNMVNLMARASLVYWKSELWTAGLRGYEAFLGSSCDGTKLEPKTQIWVPDRDILISEERAEEERLGLNTTLSAVLVVGSFGEIMRSKENRDLFKDNMVAGFFYVTGKKYHLSNPEGIKDLDERLRDPERRWTVVPTFRLFRWTPEDKADNCLAGLLALANFMNQPFVDLRKHEPPRPERRRLQKAGKHWPDVRHIILRRSLTQQEQHRGDGQIDYSCHFLVQGHWRNQWYPSKQTHQPKRIEPYLKGDLEKPFKPPSKTIYSVER